MAERARTPGWGSFEVDSQALLAAVARRKAVALIGLGILMRLSDFLADRAPNMDERALKDSIDGMPLFEFFTMLRNGQVAPGGFLTIERIASRVFSGSAMGVRLFPLICGIASMFLFHRLARRLLAPRAALLALTLFVVSDELVYYSSEIKQYATEVLAALLCTRFALDVLDQGLDGRRLAALTALSTITPWFALSSTFVIGAAGMVLIGTAAAHRRWRTARLLLIPAVAWTASFAGAFLDARAQQGRNAYIMDDFWKFSFLPLPPKSLADCRALGSLLLDVFVNPLDLVVPALPWLTIVPPLVYLIIGGADLLRRRRGAVLVFILSAVLVFIASGLRWYPFHGRLLLFLVPALLILIADGLERIAARNGRLGVFPVLAFLLLIYPCLSTAYGLSSIHAHHKSWVRFMHLLTTHSDLPHDVFGSTSGNETATFFKRGAQTRPRQGSAPQPGPVVSTTVGPPQDRHRTLVQVAP